MYETQYILLFLAGCALTAGAWTDHAAGFSAGAGVFVWIIIGFASLAVEPAQADVVASPALAWLSFGNAGMHAVRLALHLQAVMSDADEDAMALDPIQQLRDTDDDLPNP
ncbi:hypothetical protein [Haloplanus halophilus]|uniref:hypothetical protein n=1 Tax=Haloplanus halophilus TaxID=2949993 RepID=UPI00203C9B21|nr:hypothetical protein [Haloplanus sp. GDY1]